MMVGLFKDAVDGPLPVPVIVPLLTGGVPVVAVHAQFPLVISEENLVYP